MTMPARIYNRVLVLLDGSTAAEFAVRFGIDLAAKHDADLLLVHLQALPVGPEGSTGPDDLTPDQSQHYLDDLHKDANAAGVRAQTQAIQARDLAGTLHKVIETEHISVLVMSTQGRVGMLRWLFGTGVEKALNELPVPVLLVRPMYQTIVVPLDGSRWS